MMICLLILVDIVCLSVVCVCVISQNAHMLDDVGFWVFGAKHKTRERKRVKRAQTLTVNERNILAYSWVQVFTR